MMAWVRDKVFNTGDEFVAWLASNYGQYISRSITAIHVHHTWKPNHSNTQSTLTLHRNMRNHHVNTNRWADIAQHISIGKDGKVVLGRNITSPPASATGYNGSTTKHPFMFEMIGDFDIGRDKLAGSQLSTVLAISRYFHITAGKPIRFHNEMSSKTCPGSGINKDTFVNQVKNYKAGSTPPPASSVSKGYLQRDDRGAEVKKLQQKLLKAGYSLPKFGADGHYGDETIQAVKALQRKHGLTIDGLFGKKSEDALNKEIKEKEGELTVSQAKELQKQIDDLKKLVNKKLDKPTKREVSNWADESVKWAHSSGITDASKPYDYSTREETTTMIKRYHDEHGSGKCNCNKK